MNKMSPGVGGVRIIPDAIMAFVDNPEIKQAISNAAADRGLAEPEFEVRGIEMAMAHLSRGMAAGLMILDLTGEPEPEADLATLAATAGPGVKIIALGPVNDIRFYRRMRAAGAVEYLTLPLDLEALYEALEHGEQAPVALADGKKAKVIVVIGARGGVGATTCALGLAWLLSNANDHTVAAVDLDLHFGTMPLALDLEASRGLREALEQPERIDGLFISSAMSRHSDRLFVLGSEEPVDSDLSVDPAALDLLLEEMSSHFDYIVIELPRSYNSWQKRALAVATQAVVVSDLSLPGVRDTMRLTEGIHANAPGLPITFIANSVIAKRKHPIKPGDFEKAASIKLSQIVPFDPLTEEAAISGKPLPLANKNAKLSKALAEIAAVMAPPTSEAAKKRFTFRWK